MLSRAVSEISTPVAPATALKVILVLMGTSLSRQSAALLVSLLLFSFPNHATPGPARDEEVVQGMDDAAKSRETNLSGYSVTEHYTIHNSRFQSSAEMTVDAIYRRVSGKSYSVRSRSGSSFLQTRVLDRLLIEEAEMSRGATRQQALVTSANYKMTSIGKEFVGGRNCEVVELLPRTKGPHLLNGRAWVDQEDYSLVRIEGKANASPSFLAGRPVIVREYEKVEGFSFAKRSHAVSDSILLGHTELTIEYDGYKVTGTAPVARVGAIGFSLSPKLL